MDPKLQPVYTNERLPLPRTGDAVVVSDQNRVLRNTYWLLALSMLPTIVGAWAGMQFNFVRLFVAARSEEHTSELQSRQYLVCRLLLEKKKNKRKLTTMRQKAHTE